MSEAHATQPDPRRGQADTRSGGETTSATTRTSVREDDHLRVGAVEREAAQERLRDAVVHDLLTLDEYGQRLEIAMTAKTRGDLRSALVDLPEPDEAPFAQDDDAEDAGTANLGSQQAVRAAPERKLIVGVMGGDEATGRWRPGSTTTAIGVMGGAKLDLRRAEFDGDVLTINAVAAMGGVEIIVPDGVEVTLSGFAFMGGRSAKVSGTIDPAAPIVHVNGYAVMGGVDIRNPTQRERKRAERDGDPPPAEIPLRPEGYRRTRSRQGAAARQHPASRVSNLLGRALGPALMVAALALPVSWIATSDEVAGAVFGSNETAITTQDIADGNDTVALPVLFGSVELTVPEGVRVERDGIVIFGDTACPACANLAAGEDVPTVTVRSFGGFGSVEIVRGPAR